jgi:signal transduction histidine kinase
VSLAIQVQTVIYRALIEVQDNGPGIPLEHRSHIFKRFFRIDETRSRAEGGTAFGPSIAQWAVVAHEGSIEVQSVMGQGEVFCIQLPKVFSTTGAFAH